MKVNTNLLRSWVDKQKKTNPYIKADLQKSVRISHSLLDKVLCGKVPGPQTRFMLAHVTGLNEEELFPVVGSDEGAA